MKFGVTRRRFVAGLAGAAASSAFAARPTPFGAVPSPRQLMWHQMETTAFVHLGLNTFTDKEWGYGDDDPNLFQPARFDADSIIEALAAANLRGVVLTCKHHDGFCLWPTKTTEYSVRASSWRGGQGDVVRDIANAARRRGMKFGVNLSPWDRNNAAYGTPGYVGIYRQQVTELLTNYGPVFEFWHSAANGGDGYYGGAREKRTIDGRSYYDWPGTGELIRKLQPEAVIFGESGPDIRWVGNPRGIAGDPCWATYDPDAVGSLEPGDFGGNSPSGTAHGAKWIPAEADVSIRPGWYWHANETPRVKTPGQLRNLYHLSVGRGANLMLNVPPTREGLIDAADAASLKGFGDYLRQTFGNPVAVAGARQLGNPEVVLDVQPDSPFNVIRIREDIRFGQRIDAVSVDSLENEVWKPLATATSVGPRRIIRLPAPVTAAKVRVIVTQSAAPGIISDFGVYREAPV